MSADIRSISGKLGDLQKQDFIVERIRLMMAAKEVSGPVTSVVVIGIDDLGYASVTWDMRESALPTTATLGIALAVLTADVVEALRKE